MKQNNRQQSGKSASRLARFVMPDFRQILTVAVLLIAPSTYIEWAHAQNLAESFSGFSSDSNKPIDIESDTLEVQDQKKIAIFKGNVKAIQGDFKLRSKELEVKYAGQNTPSSSNSEITQIKAQGKVLITTPQKQTATSDWALFDVKSNLITIGGNVVLSQGKNVLKGEKLVIDLKTGKSRFETGRVKGKFTPKQFKRSESEKKTKAPENRVQR